MIAAIIGLMWVGPHAGAPDPDSPPGSGIIVSAEITAIWLPRPLLDLARDQGGSPAVQSPEELLISLGLSGSPAA
jgi:hypothetical protein